MLLWSTSLWRCLLSSLSVIPAYQFKPKWDGNHLFFLICLWVSGGSFADVHQPHPCQQLPVSQEVRRVALPLVYIVLHCSLLPTSSGFLSSFIQITGSFLCSTPFQGQCRFRESGNAGTVKCVDTRKGGENWSHSSFIYQIIKVPLVSHYLICQSTLYVI